MIYGGISILAASASNIFNFFHVHKYVSLKPVGNYNFKQHFNAVAVFFAMSCATTIYTHLDTVMLGFMTSDVDVGYYNAAVKIKSILVSIVTSLGVVLLPRASYYVEHNLMEEFYRITKKAYNFVFLVAYADDGIFYHICKGRNFLLVRFSLCRLDCSNADYYAYILLLIGLTNIMGIQMLVPLGREKAVLYSEIAGVIVDVILNALLIPKMASAGAAIGTLAAEAAVLMVQYIALRNEIKNAFRNVHYGSLVIALATASILSVFIKQTSFGIFTMLCVSAVVFFGVYFGILTVMKEPLVIDIENQLLKKIKHSK